MHISPFTSSVAAEAVDDLRARIRNTRWPAAVATDWSRGVPLAYAKTLAERWSEQFDWVKSEAELNAYPQFTTEIDGQRLHFLHVRSERADAVPLLLVHGYPSSFVEFTTVVDALVAPREHGGAADGAFHVVIPSLPGVGFSTPLSGPGWGIARTAEALDALMTTLGYARYGVHGGDIGAGVCEQLCITGGERVLGSLVVTDPGAIATDFTPPTDHLTGPEQARLAELKSARTEDFGYLALQTTRPQSVAYALSDSPVAQLTWIVEKVKEWSDPSKPLPEDAVDIDQLLTLVSVYWFGGGGAGAANFLYEAMHAPQAWGLTHDRPQGFVAFGREPLIRRILDPQGTVAFWREHAEGGHFPAMEQPGLLVDDLRAFFSSRTLETTSRYSIVEARSAHS
jgi:pimeloyl-ACP methyl ester carboxylesterase